MATTAQNFSAPNKHQLDKSSAVRCSPQAATPQNIKVDNSLANRDQINQNTAKTSLQASNFVPRANERQVMTLQNSHIQGRKVDSPKIYVNESESRDPRPKTSAQGSRKIKNDKKPPQGDVSGRQKNKKPSYPPTQSKTPSGSCPTIFSALKVQTQPQRIDFTFQKEDLDCVFTGTDQENAQKIKQIDKYANEPLNKSTSRLQNTQISKYQQTRQLANATRPKSIGISSRVQRKRHLSQGMTAGTASVKQAKVIKLPSDSQVKSPQNNQDVSALNISTQLVAKLQGKLKFNAETRERRTRSSDLNSRPSLAAASRKGMQLKNSQAKKYKNPTDANNSSTGQANSKNQEQDFASGNQQIKVSWATQRRQNFSFDPDNKENYPSNSSLQNQKTKLIASDRSKSLSAGRSHKAGQQKKKNLQSKLSLSSLSRSSPNLKVEVHGDSITKMLGKQYFVDGEQMLRIMSSGTPTKSEDRLKSLVSGGGQNNSDTRKSSPNKYSNSRRHKEAGIRKTSNNSNSLKRTLESKSGDHVHKKDKKQDQSLLKKEKRNLETTLKQKLQAQELLKKFMEETQRKTEREEQRIKTNEMQRLQEILTLRSKQKKKRSKSCISKIGEAVLSSREQVKEQYKESANQTCLLSDALSGSQKRHAPKELSCVMELNNLKKEINDEIRRERKENGLLPRAAQTPGAQKPQYDQGETKFISKLNASTLNYTSLRLSDPQGLVEAQKKSEERQKKESKKGDINHSKIRKYIERQKRKQQIKVSMEETITHEKHLKVKQTLWDLQNFQKTSKERSTPQQISSGPLRLTSHSINIKKIQATNKSSTQQIQLLDHVRKNMPMKNFKSNHTAKALKKKKKSIVNFNESSQFDSVKDMRGKTGFLDDDATGSNLEATYNNNGPILENDDSTTNINIFSQQISQTISSNTGGQKSKSPGARRVNNDIISEYPLKELKTRIVKQKPSGSAKGPAKRRSQDQGSIQKSKDQITISANSNGTANFKQSNFESLEPSRPTGQDDLKNSKLKSRSTPKTNSDQMNNLYDQSAVAVRRKPDTELQKSLAATLIQKYVRGFLIRKLQYRVKNSQGSPGLSSAPLTEKNNTAQSIRKTMIPSLNLQKINSTDSNPQKSYTVAPTQKNKQQQKSQDTNSARSQTLFDRGSFQQIKNQGLILPQSEQIDNIPELIKIREENIKRQQEAEQRKLQLELSQNKVSPRTYQAKQRDLEIWVTNEREKVNQLMPKQKAVDKEWERTEQYMKNAYQDYDQINKILGSARSSQRSKQPPRHLMAEELLASSARTGLNSYRIDSQRQSHREKENRIIDLIYDKKPVLDKGLQESSSNSQVKRDHKNNSSSQNSKSNSQSQVYESPRDQESDLQDEMPNFDKVVVFNQTKKLSTSKNTHLNAEPTLNRQTSYKILGEQAEEGQDSKNEPKTSPKHQLSKTDARSRLHELIDDDVDELARQVFQVSPAASSEYSRHALKNDFKESLKSDNFFLKKTDQGIQSPKTSKNNNIRIEIGEEIKPTSQALTNAFIGTVSPLSDASSNLGIQRGCMSLESSTSGENREKLAQVISEMKNDEQIHSSLNHEQIEYAEHLTNEIMQLLVVEMKIDFEFLVNRDAAQAQKNQQQQQQDQMGLQQIGGIKTDLFAIEKYVDEVVDEIKLNAVEFMKVLNAPMSKNHVQLLNQLQNTEIGSCEHFNENFPQILPLDLYLTLEKRRKEVREQQVEQNNERSGAGTQAEMLRILIAECEHIHNKVLFDCINDSLLQFKPYGKDGEPLPWGRKNRRLKPTDDFTINEIFEIVKHDLFRWAITQAGTLPRREFVYRGVFDEELFSEIREKKLVSLLGREMIENENKWLNYEFEQAQVKIDVGDMILELLVTETIKILSESGLTQQEIALHPLMAVQAPLGDNNQEIKPLEPYEAHILTQMGLNGAHSQDSQDQSDNSKDSDFSRNEVESNSNVLADEFDDNYFDDDRS